MSELFRLTQKDEYHFEIEWSDKTVQVFRLSTIQERCPCVRCVEGKKVTSCVNVKAIKLMQVGNYALKIQFTKGCSKGIYPFKLLREIGL